MSPCDRVRLLFICAPLKKRFGQLLSVAALAERSLHLLVIVSHCCLDVWVCLSFSLFNCVSFRTHENLCMISPQISSSPKSNRLVSVTAIIHLTVIARLRLVQPHRLCVFTLLNDTPPFPSCFFLQVSFHQSSCCIL